MSKRQIAAKIKEKTNDQKKIRDMRSKNKAPQKGSKM